MKVTTHYSSIERIVYEFTEQDIEEALMKSHGIKWKSGQKIDFEIIDDIDSGKCTAEIIVSFEKPLAEPTKE